MFYTRVCEILGIRYPIIKGGMAWVSDYRLTAAVSNAGGLGLIAAGSISDEELVRTIGETRRLTDKPFGVNIVPIAGVSLMDRIRVIAAEGVRIVATAFSDPTMPIVSEARKAGAAVICVVPSVRLAKRVEGEGADIIVASGTEAGGHVGRISTLTLVPQVVDAVQVPVVAGGGIADGRGFLAALALGASGIQMGTRFIVSQESPVHPDAKACILAACEEDTVVTGNITGSPVRCLRNRFTDYWLSREAKEGHTAKEDLQREGMGRLRKGMIEGDLEHGTLAAGQACGLIREEKTAQAIVEDIIAEAAAMCDAVGRLRAKEPPTQASQGARSR